MEMFWNKDIAGWLEDRASFGLFTTDPRLVVTGWNWWLESHSGRARQEVIGKSLLDLYPDLVTRQMDRYFDEALEGRHVVLSPAFHGYLLPVKRGDKGGSDAIMAQNATISPLILDDGISGIIGYIEDVSERVQREKELMERATEHKQGEETLKKRTRDLDERVKELNCLYGISELVETPDISLEEIYQGVADLMPHAWQYSGTACARIILGNQEFRSNNFRETNSKQTEDIRVEGEKRGMVEVFYLEEKPENDEGPFQNEERYLVKEIAERLGKITERKQANEALQRSEFELRQRNRIANIFLTIPDEKMYGEVLQVILEAMESKYGIFAYIDEDGAAVAPSITRGVWEECQIPNKRIRFPRETWGDNIWSRAIIQKRSLYSNEPGRVPKGHVPITRSLVVPIIYHGEVIGHFEVANKPSDYDEKDLAFLENLTQFIAPVLNARLQRDRKEEERKKLEDQLRQSQKMEAISTLAGGIAHDFNNILSSIMGYGELAQMELAPESKAYADLKEVLQSGNRAKLLIQQILAVGRSQEQERHPMQLKYIVKEALKFLKSTLPSTIEIRETYDKDVGMINADPTQMNQVLMNLCTNAGHAMDKDGGILEVSLRNTECEKAEPHLQPGQYLELTVSDTGYGIAPEIREKIFDPYFTTKELGVGTGIGLSLVHGIVTVAVGMRVASHPPHRSQQAELPHWAPTSGSDVHAQVRIWVIDAGSWEPTIYEPVHSFPIEPMALATTKQRFIP